jgi:hypothetical protein
MGILRWLLGMISSRNDPDRSIHRAEVLSSIAAIPEPTSVPAAAAPPGSFSSHYYQ